LPYLKKAIVENPRTHKEKRNTERACYYLARTYIKDQNLEEAKKYYYMGKNALTSGSTFYDGYKELKEEIFQEKYSGTLYRIILGKGYGFIERDDQKGIPIFVHCNNIIPRISLDEFEKLEGKKITFNIIKEERGYKALNVRLDTE
jgi:cold shock CspA family protein